MQLKTILLSAKKQIPSLDAEILACEAFQFSKSQLITQADIIIPTEQKQIFLEYINQRKNGKSISEIFQKKNFYGYNFIISNDVLTPRPETEVLVETVFEYSKNNNVEKIIDIGTGSGCIIITLALLLKKKGNTNFLAVDISEKALKVANLNAKKMQTQNIIFKKSDLLSAISKEELENACIVTNLPYIPENDELPKEVMNGDPKLALFSGKTGADLYTKFFTSLPDIFSAVFFEFDPPQKEYFQKLLSELFPKRKISFFSDYSGKERFGIIL